MDRNIMAKKQKIMEIGGQAVIEGVMMKSKKRIVTSIRKGKKIISKKREFIPIIARKKIYKTPIIRGIISIFELMIVGMQELAWSADQQTDEKQGKLTWLQLLITFSISILAVIGIFIIAPYYLTKVFYSEINIWFNLIDGGFRVLMFVLYLAIIGLMADMKRVFQYHGAEHKSVNCYEAGKKLTVSNVKKFSTIHPRCGTSLLVFVIVISILLFSLIKDPRWYVNIPFRIILIPVIVGISFEIVKLSAKFKNSRILKALIIPGLWTQKLTTREPDSKQIEVAIKSLKKAM
ncbi:DUF1385 domain-containing protein [Candidatus Woesearchaeota archaeon]|nr:DUF1385 domain-containing protein [Candidatus Woesearchaeota archaeon]MBW2978899.1 DUF1385 domain-containing protein [Candidatus Woesearchaeota archaeon]